MLLRRPQATIATSFILALTLTSAPGCKRRGAVGGAVKDAGDETTPPVKDPTLGLVLVFSGGFNSCARNKIDKLYSPYGTSLFPKLNQLSRVIGWERKTSAMRWVASCFGKEIGQLRWYTSSDPKTMREGDESGYAAAIRAEAKLAGENHRLLFVGHSWGGSLVMDTVHTLTTLDVVKEKDVSLVTIDPISRFNCQPTTFFQMLTKPGSGDGCQGAPTHIKAQQLDQLKAALGKGKRWLHFWQNQFGALHSGPLAQARAHVKPWELTVSTYNPMAPHTEIAKDKAVWREIYADFLLPLGINPPMEPAMAPQMFRDAADQKRFANLYKLQEIVDEFDTILSSAEEESARTGVQLAIESDSERMSAVVFVRYADPAVGKAVEALLAKSAPPANGEADTAEPQDAVGKAYATIEAARAAVQATVGKIDGLTVEVRTAGPEERMDPAAREQQLEYMLPQTLTGSGSGTGSEDGALPAN